MLAAALTSALRLRPAPRPGKPAEHAPAAPRPRSALLSPAVLLALAIGVGSGLLTAPMNSVVVPARFHALGEPTLFGWALGTAAAGSLLGSVLYSWVAAHALRLGYLVSIVVATVGFGLMASLPGAPLMFGALACIGLAGGMLSPVLVVAITRSTSPAQRGSVFGVFNALGLGVAPVGLAAFGALLAARGLKTGAMSILVGWLAVALVALAGTRWMLAPTPRQEAPHADHR